MIKLTEHLPGSGGFRTLFVNPKHIITVRSGGDTPSAPKAGPGSRPNTLIQIEQLGERWIEEPQEVVVNEIWQDFLRKKNHRG